MANSENKIQKGLAILKTKGVAAFFKKLILSIKNRIYLRQRYLVYEWDNKPAQMNLREGFVFYKVSSLQGLENLNLKDPKVRELINKGVVVFYILRNNIISHTTMVATNKEQSIDVLAPKMSYEGTGYIGACETLEEQRGKGLYSYAIAEAARHLEGLNRKAIITTEEHNTASIRGIEQAGYRLRGEGVYTKILFWDFWKETKKAGDLK